MIKFYRTHLNSWWLRVFPFIILPALIFSAKYLHDPGGFEKSTEILFGSIFTVILAAHGQLFANASKQESAATEFWENKAHGYLWLLRCIETLIHRKRSYLVEE
ncbi:MAG TPA: hypothetical protein VFA47_10660, partial [Candidatus Manganitrophaceae bacterium]|nr:hypothetical protein [Candidatus Manganitrophaceae bacterium]